MMKDGRNDRETSQFLPSVFAPVFYCTKRESTTAEFILSYFFLFFKHRRKSDGKTEIRESCE